MQGGVRGTPRSSWHPHGAGQRCRDGSVEEARLRPAPRRGPAERFKNCLAAYDASPTSCYGDRFQDIADSLLDRSDPSRGVPVRRPVQFFGVDRATLTRILQRSFRQAADQRALPLQPLPRPCESVPAAVRESSGSRRIALQLDPTRFAGSDGGGGERPAGLDHGAGTTAVAVARRFR